MDFEKLVKVAQGLKTITEHVQKVSCLIVSSNCIITTETLPQTSKQGRYYK